MLRWALATFIKGIQIRLHKNWLSILAEREVPHVEIDDGLVNFMINYDGYGFVPAVWRVPRPTQPHSTPPYPTTCTITSPRTPGNTDTTPVVRLSSLFWRRIKVSKRLLGWFLQMINAKLFWLGI